MISDNEMSDLFGWCEIDDSSNEGEGEVKILVCDKIKNLEEEKYSYFSIVNSLS